MRRRVDAIDARTGLNTAPAETGQATAAPLRTFQADSISTRPAVLNNSCRNPV
jgi:hypothetical protein